MKRITVFLIILLILIAVFTGCSRPTPEPPTEPPSVEPPVAPTEEPTEPPIPPETPEPEFTPPSIIEVEWETGGPYGYKYGFYWGYRIIFGDREGKVVYAVGLGNSWISEDSGKTWQEVDLPVIGGFDLAPEIETIEQPLGAHTDDRMLVELFGSHQGLRETLGLDTERPVVRTWYEHLAWLKQDPNNPKNLLLGVDDIAATHYEEPDSHHSVDKGHSWTRDGDVVRDTSLFLSIDGGKSWIRLNIPPPYPERYTQIAGMNLISIDSFLKIFVATGIVYELIDEGKWEKTPDDGWKRVGWKFRETPETYFIWQATLPVESLPPK